MGEGLAGRSLCCESRVLRTQIRLYPLGQPSQEKIGAARSGFCGVFGVIAGKNRTIGKVFG
jgi:hypothetical protein